MPMVKINRLRSLPFLQGASNEVLRGLANASSERSFDSGEVILEEGSWGRDLYVILEGSVQVVKGRGAQELLLAQRGPGDMFGEMGLIEGRPRFATVRAGQPTRVLTFSEHSLNAMFAEQPALLYPTIRVLMARLREADLKMIGDLQSKNLELAQAYRELQEAQTALLEKERMERELQLARDLQQTILPHTFPSIAGLDIAACSRPAREVGGDFYDVILLSKDRLGLVMADVSDKGMPAALYMALTRSLIHAEAKRSASPRRVLRSVHRLLREMSKAEMFVTVFYGVWDVGRQTLRYSRAGHDWPLLVNSTTSRCQELTAAGMMLGIMEDIQLEEDAVTVKPGDVLVLYTDGITDANSPSGEFYGVERLRDAVCAAVHMDVQTLCDCIFRSVADFQQGTAQHDDMAVLAVRSDPAQRRVAGKSL